MRDSDRIKIMLSKLEQLWEKYPDMRLGQLLVILSKPIDPCPEVFYIEDDELEKRIMNVVIKGNFYDKI